MPNNTDRAWEQWGKKDPYYGVFTKEEYRRKNLDASRDSFFEAGRQHLSGVIKDVESRFGPLPRNSALDFGCGVGRVLLPLCSEFSCVDGLDISAGMLREAATNLGSQHIENATLHSSDDKLSAIQGKTYDFVHTYVVLQHIPPARGYSLIDQLLSHVAPGGAFYIHVCLKRMLMPAREAVYFVKHRLPLAYIAFNAIQGKPLDEMPMQMNEYDFVALSLLFRKHGFETVTATQEVHESAAGSHLTAGLYSRHLN